MKRSLDATVIRVKADNNFCEIVISHGEYICALIENIWVYGMGTGTRICVGAGVQCLFSCSELMM